MTAITMTSEKLDESFTFTTPSDGGYVRVGNGKGDYNQIFPLRRSGRHRIQ